MIKLSLTIYPLLVVTLLFIQIVQAENYTNSIGMKFVLVPAGSFMMGAHEFENGNIDEKPQHKVTISKPFYLGIYEVTQEQWVKVMGDNPSKFQNDNRPVESVFWEDINVFISKLNQIENTDKYRLPTEAEWEYAARAGSSTAYCYGDDLNAEQLHQYGWGYTKNTESKTKFVGKLKPNAWGLYDMHGNVWERVHDWYDNNYYRNSPANDPRGPSSGQSRVNRGGSWKCDGEDLRSAYRYNLPYEGRYDEIGFRLLRTH